VNRPNVLFDDDPALEDLCPPEILWRNLNSKKIDHTNKLKSVYFKSIVSLSPLPVNRAHTLTKSHDVEHLLFSEI